MVWLVTRLRRRTVRRCEACRVRRRLRCALDCRRAVEAEQAADPLRHGVDLAQRAALGHVERRAKHPRRAGVDQALMQAIEVARRPYDAGLDEPRTQMLQSLLRSHGSLRFAWANLGLARHPFGEPPKAERALR